MMSPDEVPDPDTPSVTDREASPSRSGTDGNQRAADHDQPSRRRQWLFRTVAVALPTIVGLITIVSLLFYQQRLVWDELGFRWQAPPIYLQEPGFEKTGHKYLYDPQLGWRNIPNWSASTNGHPLTINGLGMRDRPRDQNKAANVKRILVLGDSYAWGYGVADQETFASVLEDNLQDRGTWEVLNSGVSGWGTDQQLLYLLNEGFQLEPDLVILAFFVINDPTNNLYSKQYGLHKPMFVDESLRLANVPVPKPTSGLPRLQSRSDPQTLTHAIVRQMARECRQRNVPLIVMKFGMFLEEDAADYVNFNEQFTNAMRARQDLLLLDLDTYFQQKRHSKEALLKGNDTGHWNADGHRWTADAIQAFLTANGLIAAADQADRP